jgi:hypothetical protein
MSLRRLGILQWAGLLVGAATWTGQHVTGIGITQAECNVAGASFGISNPVWQGALMGASATVIVLAMACAAIVFVHTRGKEFGTGPTPADEKDDVKPGRLHFFAAAALITNLLMLMIVLLDGSANLVNIACRQS